MVPTEYGKKFGHFPHMHFHNILFKIDSFTFVLTITVPVFYLGT